MNWEHVRARSLFREVNERGHDLPLASVTKDGGVEFRSDLDISVWNPGEETSHYKRVQPCDFVIGLRSFQSGLGHSPLEGLVSPAYTVLRTTDASVHHPYFKHLFKSSWLISKLENVAQGIRQGRTIATEDFYDLVLPLPPLPTQRAIAGFLDTEATRIDALITKKRRMIDLLEDQFAERVRRAVLLEATYPDPLQVSRGDARLPGVRVMRLSWLAAFGSGTTPEAGAERYYGGGIPWVLTGDLSDGEIQETSRSITEEALADYSALKVHPVGSLVVAMYGATIGKMGVLGVAAAVNQACCVIAPGPDLDTDFLYLYLFGFRKEVIERGRGSGQPNISQEILRSLRLAVPPVDEQRAVVTELRRSWGRVQQATTALSKQIALLHEHRQALITAAVTGELEVPGVAA